MNSGGSLRVLVVIDSLGQGGAEQSLIATLPRLRKFGIEPSVAVLRSVAAGREAELSETGVPVQVLGTPKSIQGTARALRPLLKDADLLHVSLFTPIVAGGVAALGTDVPVLASLASTPVSRHEGARHFAGSGMKLALASWLERWACRNLVTHLHAVTDGVRDLTAQRFRLPIDRITTVQRGRDGSRFVPPSPAERAEARRSLSIAETDRLLVTLARHDPAKALEDTLVPAVARLASNDRRVRLLVAGGKGPSTQALRESIDQAGIGEQVTLLGDVLDPERVLAAADVFVLSSRREGTSGATLEAMAMGLPIAATTPLGMRGLLTDEVNALTCEVEDDAAIAAAIRRLLDDPVMAERLGSAARSTFDDHFTIEAAASGMAALYNELAVRGRVRRFRA